MSSIRYKKKDGPPKRAVSIYRLTESSAVKLSLLPDLVSTVRLAGRIERFPSRLLPGSAPVTQVDGGLVQHRVETGTLGIGNARRHQRAAPANALGVGVSIRL
jgi:hypothetical protein